MTQEMKNKLNTLSRLYAAWDAINAEDYESAQEQIDKVIISITQELVDLYQNRTCGFVPK